MATKKVLKKKVQAKPSAGKMTDTVLDSARDIWLAGLGAFSMAQHEGGKLIDQGNKLFDKLVAEGAKLESKTRGLADRKVVDLRGEVGSRMESVRKQAADNWDKLEGIFEDRVARVLGRLGVPTADDVEKLSERVRKLSEQVAVLAEKRAAKPAGRRATRKTAARKTTAKGRKAAARAKPEVAGTTQ